MKKFLILGIVLSIGFMAGAYRSLEFKTIDGKTYIADTEGLVIDITGSNLIITNKSDAYIEIPTASIESMQFTDKQAAVDKIELNPYEGEVKVYSAEGIYIGKFSSDKIIRESLSSGIYILQYSTGKTIKILNVK